MTILRDSFMQKVSVVIGTVIACLGFLLTIFADLEVSSPYGGGVLPPFYLVYRYVIAGVCIFALGAIISAIGFFTPRNKKQRRGPSVQRASIGS
jgi:hypothetical protein